MPDNKIIEDLGVAYKTEINGYAFYLAAARIASNDRGKNIFSHLAKEELDHIRVVSAIGAALKIGQGWIGYDEAVKKAVSAGEGAPIFQGENELVKRLEKNPTDINALNIATENEDKAIAFYTRLLNGADSPEEKVVLTKLLEMEKGHLKILRWELESLVKTGFWGDSMEFSVEMEKD